MSYSQRQLSVFLFPKPSELAGYPLISISCLFWGFLFFCFCSFVCLFFQFCSVFPLTQTLVRSHVWLLSCPSSMCSLQCGHPIQPCSQMWIFKCQLHIHGGTSDPNATQSWNNIWSLRLPLVGKIIMGCLSVCGIARTQMKNDERGVLFLTSTKLRILVYLTIVEMATGEPALRAWEQERHWIC